MLAARGRGGRTTVLVGGGSRTRLALGRRGLTMLALTMLALAVVSLAVVALTLVTLAVMAMAVLLGCGDRDVAEQQGAGDEGGGDGGCHGDVLVCGGGRRGSEARLDRGALGRGDLDGAADAGRDGDGSRADEA